MNYSIRVLLLLSLLLTSGVQAQITYRLVSGNESWPSDKHIAIIQAMDEAVSYYNNNGYFVKSLTVEYNSAVPTADANYNGHIRFGGSISARTAMHEISHTLGVGTTSQWRNNVKSNGTWVGGRATARVLLYNGSQVKVGCGNIHFWSTSGPTYGLNYPREDGSTNRIRHVRMASALRWDMGLVSDSDNDGMPDDWETFYFKTLDNDGDLDFDDDGASNLEEYNADTNPTLKYEWIKVDDRVDSVSYDANWAEYPSNPSYNTTVNYSETNGATTTFSFEGTQVRYYGFKRSDLGFADIYIDDVLVTSVDCYSTTNEVDKLLFESDVLEMGSHTLKVVVSGNKNEASSGTEIIIDAFEFFQGSTLTSVTTNIFGEDYNSPKVYPNPSKDAFTIELLDNKTTTARIYDLQGQLVYQSSFRKKIHINTSEIAASGLLVIQLATDKITHVEKLVVE